MLFSLFKAFYFIDSSQKSYFFFLRKDFFPHTCESCSELPYKSTMGRNICLSKYRVYALHKLEEGFMATGGGQESALPPLRESVEHAWQYL